MTGLEEGHLAIDTGSGAIVDVGESAAALLGIDASALTGKPLQRALDITTVTADAVAQAVKSRQTLALPPFLARRQDGAELVLEGQLHPRGGNVSRPIRHATMCNGWPVFHDEYAFVMHCFRVIYPYR